MNDAHSPRLLAAVREWGTPQFERTLKRELEALDGASLPLHAGTNEGGLVDDTSLAVTVIGCCENSVAIEVRVGVFFAEIVGGCSCGDEPLSSPAYCMLLVTIEKQTARAVFEVIDETAHDAI